MRVVVADDDVLLRRGLIELLRAGGFEVVGEAGDPATFLELVRSTMPDVAVLDIRMPPTHTLEGLEAAARVRAEHGDRVAIVLLSQHVEAEQAAKLLERRSSGIGYLLKERVLDPDELFDAIRRVAAGGTAIDPVVVEQLLRRRERSEPVATLTEREREVLAAMAQGRSNQWIAENLHVSSKTVEAHTGRIFMKLGLEESSEDHRRVLAVLAYLRTGSASAPDSRLATVLFTDIVSSSERAARLKDAGWRTVLDSHDAVVRTQLFRFEGKEVNTTGDGFVATFDVPAQAARCAIAIIEALRPLDLAIRAGLHTGQVEARGDDIGGIAVNIAARVQALAQPGEVLVSRTVADLLTGSDVSLRARGEHELRGIPGRWALFAVEP